MLRVAGYRRVSTEEQARSGYSLPEQEVAIRAEAERLGAASIAFYSDEGISGSILDRPGLSAMREAIRRKEIDMVIVTNTDRLARDNFIRELLFREFQAAGVRLLFLAMAVDDSPIGRFSMQVKGAADELESQMIRQRMINGKNGKARQGGMPVGFRVYGYDYRRGDGDVTVNEAEADVVRQIFRWLVEEDIGMNGIAKRLNESGVSTKTGRAVWHRMTIRQILTQSAYTGVWWYGRTLCKNMGKNRPKSERGKPVAKPEEEWLPIPVPAILDTQIFEQAQDRLGEIRRRWSDQPKAFYLLGGLVVCSHCGGVMYGRSGNSWGRKERVYTCQQNDAGAKNRGCRPMRRINADILESAIWGAVAGRMSDAETVVSMAEESTERSALTQERDRVATALAQAIKGRENLMRTLALGLSDLDQSLQEQLSEIKSRKDALERRFQELDAALKAPLTGIDRGEAEKLLRRLRLSIAPEARKEALRLLLRQVVVADSGPDGLNVVLYPWPAVGQATALTLPSRQRSEG